MAKNAQSAIWSADNRACKTTFTTMLSLEQIQAAFPDAGTIEMQTCAYYDTAGSSAAIALAATGLAMQLDNTFVQIRGAHYEDGVTQDAAIAGLTEVLKVGTSTLADLANVADKSYLFRGETHVVT
jgi:hypothetical protein